MARSQWSSGSLGESQRLLEVTLQAVCPYQAD